MGQQKTIRVKLSLGLTKEGRADQKKLTLSLKKGTAMVKEEHQKRTGKISASERTWTFRIPGEKSGRYLQKTGESRQEFIEEWTGQIRKEEAVPERNDPGNNGRS